MFATVILFAITAILTGVFMILELNWSIHNLMRTWSQLWGPLKIMIIPMIPVCFLPIILDVAITLGIVTFLGAEGMMGLLTSSIMCSAIAGYLFYMRRKHQWRYI
ncbi:MAG TPA: hypothetical protein VI911_10860 [Patescibacteria group bacterium]|nr:hypothetical protein [Patescibacteria group bacterium]